MGISSLRQEYHRRVCAEIIRLRRDSGKGDYPNFADGDSAISVELAWGILRRLGCSISYEEVKSQTAGKRFESLTRDFIEAAFSALQHIRPGQWVYSVNTEISRFVQYEHLDYIAQVLDRDHALSVAFGGDYIIRPDIVIGKLPSSDEEIDRSGILADLVEGHANFTVLRQKNFGEPRQLLHAVISCKWTIRTDRAQNTRTEVLNLIRNRKGHLPHIVAVTAEPWPARIAALALGTGDLDCVYHFALPELQAAVAESGKEDSMEMLRVMVEGKRLRDISDLPFDLAV